MLQPSRVRKHKAEFARRKKLERAVDLVQEGSSAGNLEKMAEAAAALEAFLAENPHSPNSSEAAEALAKVKEFIELVRTKTAR